MAIPLKTIILVPINLDDLVEFAELQDQRKVCGWDHETEVINTWRDKQKQKLKALFWVVIEDNLSTVSPEDNKNRSVRIGHVSLDSESNPPDPELAREDKTILTIRSFFILPQYQSGGFGRRVMEIVETLATKEPYGSPQCKAIALTTLHKRYLYDDSPEWGGIYKHLSRGKPPFSLEEWYEKLGYVRWKTEPRYPERTIDGRDILKVASFMRKTL